uniref:Sorting nexin-25 n=1 Tax=Timema tahoe TaxID=61484 RepID=A0A7R9IJ25_9NEOP|nr:unnamed protein product [Timema tahoe]
MYQLYLLSSLGTLLLALIFQPEWTLVLVGMVLVTLAVVSAIILIYVNFSSKCVPSTYSTQRPTPELDAWRSYLTRHEPKVEKPLRLPVIFGRMVDGILQQLMDLALRDFVGRLFNDLGFESYELIQDMKVDIWSVIHNIQERMSKVDKPKLIAVDLVNKVTFHFERVRFAQAAHANTTAYYLPRHLESPERERDYLRKMSEHVIHYLFPPCYSAASPIRHLVREVLTCKAIELITDPDFINQKVIVYIQQQSQTDVSRKKPFAYASTFDDFMQMIKNSSDVEDLKRISFAHRYNIVTEIMQATTLHNMKRSKGLDLDILSPVTGKKDLMQGRQLKRYINQLSQAKGATEKRLKVLRGSGYPVEEAVEASTMIDTETILLTSILENLMSRRYFTQYLEQVGSQPLIGYWGAVEELRVSDKSNWHQLGAEIFYTYINTPSPEIKVDKPVLKRMEGFLLGDNGPEVFYEVQEDVVKTLEEKFYPAFLTHELYQKMQSALEETSENNALSSATPPNSTKYQHGNFREQPSRDVLTALQALRMSLKPESRVLVVLEKEVERLEGEKRQLEAHLTRTEVWGEHLGQWRASVQSAEISEDKECPQFVLVVHILEDETDSESVSTGWVVLRKLSDFQELHRKLCQLSANLKQFDLPSQSIKYRFGKQAVKSSLEKAKQQIQHYLKFVLEDERLNQSEALYTFLSPSSEHLKHVSLPSPKKSMFSFTTLFKSASGSSEQMREPGGPTPGSKDSDEEDVTLLLDEGDGRGGAAMLGDGKDGIAEPLYRLLGEIFDMKGVFKWFRKTLITFVQITYGRTINREVHETIEWLFSEQMIYFYIKKFIKSCWPNGKLIDSPLRTEEQKIQTSIEAKELVLNNIPEVLSNLVGQQNSRRGAVKVFETLQDPRLNRQLFYEILEVIIYEVCPELKSPSVKEESAVELPRGTHTPVEKPLSVHPTGIRSSISRSSAGQSQQESDALDHWATEVGLETVDYDDDDDDY